MNASLLYGTFSLGVINLKRGVLICVKTEQIKQSCGMTAVSSSVLVKSGVEEIGRSELGDI